MPLAAVIISIVVVFLVSPIKSVNNFKFAEYTSFEGKGRVDLSEGDKLLAIYNTECDHCQELAKAISSLEKNTNHFPEFYALLFSEGDVSIDVQTFFDLIGTSPPRIYWLENGKVKEVWDKEFLEHIKRIRN